eukprot:sb/3477592/
MVTLALLLMIPEREEVNPGVLTGVFLAEKSGFITSGEITFLLGVFSIPVAGDGILFSAVSIAGDMILLPAGEMIPFLPESRELRDAEEIDAVFPVTMVILAAWANKP